MNELEDGEHPDAISPSTAIDIQDEDHMNAHERISTNDSNED